MIKIILSDIDGTFLKNDKTISELHIKAAKEIFAQGKKFAMVSARMPEAIYPITDGIGLPRIPVISYSGALVLTETEEILYNKKIPLDDTKNILPNKILVMCEPPTCEDMEKKLGAQFPKLNVVRSAPHLLEIMDKSVSKAAGIEILLKHYNIKIEEAVAFGDNYNDVEMLQYIPQSVAMKNAPAAIQKIASAVTDSNEDGGIYTYLKKFEII